MANETLNDEVSIYPLIKKSFYRPTDEEVCLYIQSDSANAWGVPVSTITKKKTHRYDADTIYVKVDVSEQRIEALDKNNPTPYRGIPVKLAIVETDEDLQEYRDFLLENLDYIDTINLKNPKPRSPLLIAAGYFEDEAITHTAVENIKDIDVLVFTRALKIGKEAVFLLKLNFIQHLQ